MSASTPGRGPSPRRRWASAAGPLCALAALAGLLAMHGIQATANPAARSGLATSSTIEHSAMAHGPVDGPAPGGRHTPEDPDPGHEHPGGQVCLALLVLVSFALLLTSAVRRRRPEPASRAPSPRPIGGDRPARPPPNRFQLSVMRR